MVLAITSHLPHLDRLYNRRQRRMSLKVSPNPRVLKFSAGGFRDFTRIAASDPTMWARRVPYKQGCR